MRLSVNGRSQDLPDGATLPALVATVAGDARGVAVAVNGVVVRTADWSATELGDGDAVEVVTAHQGG